MIQAFMWLCDNSLYFLHTFMVCISTTLTINIVLVGWAYSKEVDSLWSTCPDNDVVSQVTISVDIFTAPSAIFCIQTMFIRPLI